MGRLRIPANITFNRDNWVHDIIIEKEINEEIEYPLCIKAKSGAYPEDCGGTHGYEEYCPSDNERFYSYLKFFSLEDLIKQGKAYLKRSNNIPMAVLVYLTPKEKRAELEVCAA